MNSGIIIFTDGVFGTTDAGLLEILLSQLRHNTISCSFVQVILFVFDELNWINYHHQHFGPTGWKSKLPSGIVRRFLAT